MGSLIRGWSQKTEEEKLKHQGSFTKDEIEAFWNLRTKEREEHMKYLEDLLSASKEAGRDEERLRAEADLVKAGHSPFTSEDSEGMTSEEMKARVKDWWTKSTYAYLNEPPEGNWKDVKKGTFTPELEAPSSGVASHSYGSITR